MSTYFECGIRYDKVLENGMQRKVTELYIVDALSFTEAEKRIIEEMIPFISGEFMVVTIKRTNISEVVIDEAGVQSAIDADAQKIMGMNSNASGYADKWYKAKLNYIVFDEKANKEKRTPVYMLVNAGSNHAAHALITNHMKGTLSDYEIADIVETKILDAFFYDDSRLQQQKDSRELTHELLNDKKVKKAVKQFHDAVPDGMKVSMSVNGGKETVVVDKSHKTIEYEPAGTD